MRSIDESLGMFGLRFEADKGTLSLLLEANVFLRDCLGSLLKQIDLIFYSLALSIFIILFSTKI